MNYKKAVFFDFDGTLTKPEALDFSKIRKKLNCPDNQPILEYINNIADNNKKDFAYQQLVDFEMDAAYRSKPNTGAEELITFLKNHKIAMVIISRNCMSSIIRSLKNFHTIDENDFQVIISRDLPIEAKPSPAGIQYAAEKLNLLPDDILMVGDYLFDIQAGKNAGVKTVYVMNGNQVLKAERGHLNILRGTTGRRHLHLRLAGERKSATEVDNI